MVHQVGRGLRAPVPLRRWFAALLLALLVPASAGSSDVSEAPATGPAATPRPLARLRGEVVETGCFLIGGRSGPEHEQCAIACARAGQDLGVLDEKSQTLYVAVVDRRSGPAENPLLPFVAHRVEVRGEILDRGDFPAIVISDVRSLAAPAR